MRENIEARLNELKRQLEAGQIELQQLQTRESYLRNTLLRISGAMQVLEELLIEQNSSAEIEGDLSRSELPAGPEIKQANAVGS